MTQVLVANTAEERQMIYQFRYQVYVEEMGKNPRYADHSQKQLKDKLDDIATLLYLKIDGEIAATLRHNPLHFSSLPEALQHALALDRFTARFADAALSFSSRFMIAPQWRNSLAAGAIVTEIYKIARDHGTQFDFSHASPWLVPFYENLGYRRYMDNFLDQDAGLQVPMVLLLEDIEHLRAVRSPFYRSARKLTNQNLTREWFTQAFPNHIAFFNTCQHSIDEVWEFWLNQLQQSPNRDVPLFQNLTEDNIKKLLKLGAFHSVKAGESILQLGDVTNSIFLVLSGVVQRSTLTSSACTLTTLTPYQVFGEATLFTQYPSAERVVALTDTDLLILPKQAILRAMHTIPEAICQFFLQASRSLCEKYIPRISTSPDLMQPLTAHEAA